MCFWKIPQPAQAPADRLLLLLSQLLRTLDSGSLTKTRKSIYDPFRREDKWTLSSKNATRDAKTKRLFEWMFSKNSFIDQREDPKTFKQINNRICEDYEWKWLPLLKQKRQHKGDRIKLRESERGHSQQDLYVWASWTSRAALSMDKIGYSWQKWKVC